MATTYNFTDGSITSQMIPPEVRITEQSPTILRNILDFSLQDIEAGASDVAQALIVPKDTTVLKCWARVITAETTDATIDLGYGDDADYFGSELNVDATGIVASTLKSTTVWDAGAIADGNEEAKDLTVAGAAIGDRATVTASIDLLDVELSGSVTAEDTVTAILSNNTGGEVNLASGSFTAVVTKAPLIDVPLHFAAADTIDITATDTNGDVDLDALKIEVSALCIKQIDSY